MVPEGTSFMIEAYVESPGWVSIIPRGYLVSEWAGRKWKTPLLPQMFYGAAGEQLTSWRQYIPKAGWQVILSRRAGRPRIPREQLAWRPIEDPSEWEWFLSGVIVGMLGSFALGFLLIREAVKWALQLR